MKFFYICLALFLFNCSQGLGQMIKAPTKPKKDDTPKKKAVGRVVKIKDDDETAPTDTTAAPTYAYLLIKANKGSGITVNINEKESGKIRQGMSKKIPVFNNEELIIVLNDGQGNLYDTAFVIDDNDAGKNIVVTFPEVDYAAIRAEENKEKRDRDDEERARKKEEDRIKKQQEDEEARVKREQDAEELRLRREREAEELRIKKEQQDELKRQRTDALKTQEQSILDDITILLNAKTSIQDLITKIKNGESNFDTEITNTYELFNSQKETLTNNLKIYSDSAVAYNLRDLKEAFTKIIKPDIDKIFKDNFSAFITNVKDGKIPTSQNVQAVFKASRANEIKFFISKDSLDEAVVEGKRPIIYALEVKSNATVFKYLFDNGVDPNNYGSRFPDDKLVYATPFAYACINGDIDVIKEFIVRGAKFYPDGFTKKEKKNQAKVLVKKFGSNKEVMALLNSSNYDLDDGLADITASIEFLDKNTVLVEGSSFTMGCSEEQVNECVTDEKPSIQVTVGDFYITKHEVTQKIWLAILEDANPSSFADCLDCPVETVSYNDIQVFIKKLNELSGKKYRLPYEVEWEYAARGGKEMTTVKNFMYTGSDDAGEIGWYKNNAVKTQLIGTKKPNKLGIYDMSGNVSEWCNDWYDEAFYSKNITTYPKGPEAGASKVIRGGSFTQDSWGLRVSNREGNNPETYRKNFLGFRLVLEK